ncbi:LOG family protein [Propionicicella superfundia]|uniref:LOG family protein n=1 Tax=Propionicicella superfundia TaxID=348582 RepID=UPI00041A3D2D|nr:LOG family protein [Propionicicella superfundia]
MVTELHTLAEFDAQVSSHGTVAGCFVQSLDLSARTEVLRHLPVKGAVFLGCRIARQAESRLRDAGAQLFPRLPALPFNPYRAYLYTPTDLYRGLDQGYARTVDARVDAWFRRPGRGTDLSGTLAMALHDHSIDDAFAEAGSGYPASRTVGVMGGHAIARATSEYERAVDLGRALASAGRLVVTGGGPGAMEAANLGAWFHRCAGRIPAALARLADAPGFAADVDAWAQAGFAARALADDPGFTVGVPTWVYGHEPPNVFVTASAKYFDNARREEALLQRCRGGIVYLPGAAGTVQEIFQAVTGDYYARDAGGIAPLVLLGKRHWTRDVPAWPLLSGLARGRLMAGAVHLVDSVPEALEALEVTADERR